MNDDRIEELRERLLAIAEDLSSMAIDVLRDAVDAGAEKRPELERRLTRARSAVEKAAGLLGGIGDRDRSGE